MTNLLSDLSSMGKQFNAHTQLPASINIFLCVTVSSNCKRRLKIIEALYIKQLHRRPNFKYSICLPKNKITCNRDKIISLFYFDFNHTIFENGRKHVGGVLKASPQLNDYYSHPVWLKISTTTT